MMQAVMTVNSSIQMTEMMTPRPVRMDANRRPVKRPIISDMAMRTTVFTGTKTTAVPARSFLRRHRQIQASRKYRTARASRRRTVSRVEFPSKYCAMGEKTQFENRVPDLSLQVA